VKSGERGGERNTLVHRRRREGFNKSRFREGFRAFFRSIDEKGRQRRVRFQIIACGPRAEAYSDFKKARESHPDAFNVLLVDSEGPVDQNSSALEHLRRIDKWDFPNCGEDTCHMMVQAMEAWFIAHTDALADFYGRELRLNQIPLNPNVEEVPKERLEIGLKSATKGTKKGEYHKGKHSHEILKRIDPVVVCERAPHCKKLFDVLTTAIEGTL
jgi:hypothetical protein